MGLSLNAEQKEILKIFKIEEQYVVPAYQRPYSWGYDQCVQLYNDITEAYSLGEDYFIGNIIIAKSDSNKDILEIIDGQQRLITLLLFLKTLSIYQPELNVLKQILEQEDWEGNEKKPRITSDIFEANDGSDLMSVLQYDSQKFNLRLEECTDKKGVIIERKCRNKFERNILYFYSWLKFFSIKNDLKKFISYLLKNIYLLPIELTGKTQEEANEKALIIFETINNRGMNLEDADIFKAKLYKKAKKVNEENIFIDLWVTFKYNCEELHLEIDDVFRYYSHIIRGKEGITTSEINLREFFTRESVSPFEVKKYKEILDDLFKIIEILNFIKKEKHNNFGELTKWIQLVEAYTNQYPKFAVVTYLYENGMGIKNNPKLIIFLKSLIRYIYHLGSTTRVKFEIYSVIKQVFKKLEIKEYFVEATHSDFDYLGRLKYGYALLYFYLNNNETLSNYSVDRIISLRDIESLTNQQSEWDDIVDSIGNFIVLDIPKKNTLFSKKREYYSTSKIAEVRAIFARELTLKDFTNRNDVIKNKLIDFFAGKI